MARAILMEEFHLTVYAPLGLAEAEYVAIHRNLTQVRFRANLRRVTRDVIRRHPALVKVRIALTW